MFTTLLGTSLGTCQDVFALIRLQQGVMFLMRKPGSIPIKVGGDIKTNILIVYQVKSLMGKNNI